MPKAYFGYQPAEARCRYEPMVVVDRYKAYAFLKELLQLAYCWAHMRRDFLQLRLGAKKIRPGRIVGSSALLNFMN